MWPADASLCPPYHSFTNPKEQVFVSSVLHNSNSIPVLLHNYKSAWRRKVFRHNCHRKSMVYRNIALVHWTESSMLAHKLPTGLVVLDGHFDGKRCFCQSWQIDNLYISVLSLPFDWRLLLVVFFFGLTRSVLVLSQPDTSVHHCLCLVTTDVCWGGADIWKSLASMDMRFPSSTRFSIRRYHSLQEWPHVIAAQHIQSLPYSDHCCGRLGDAFISESDLAIGS